MGHGFLYGSGICGAAALGIVAGVFVRDGSGVDTICVAGSDTRGGVGVATAYRSGIGYRLAMVVSRKRRRSIDWGWRKNLFRSDGPINGR